MKRTHSILLVLAMIMTGTVMAQQADSNQLYIDVHYLPAGKVKAKEVAAAHEKDLAVQNKYGVQFLKYWVDESQGIIYCLSSAKDTAGIRKAHQEAHGLLPQNIFQVTDGIAADAVTGKNYYLDIHQLGAGKVTAADVEKAHQKDLAVQDKYGVKFINYWVDEKAGTVLCLSQASDSTNVLKAHKEAHGLIPVSIELVKEGK
jgi:hypothetical protein